MQPHDPTSQPRSYRPPPPPELGAYPVPLPYAAMPLPATRSAADRRARAAAIALVVCGVVLLVGLLSKAWFSTRGGNVGLLGVEECRRSLCVGISWFDLPRVPAELKLLSTIGIVGIVAALGFLIQAAVVLFQRRPQKVMMVPLNGTLGIAAFGCFSFFFHLVFGELSSKLAVSWAGPVAMVGIIAASVIVAGVVRPLARVQR